jgi:hypothetical protein
MRTDINKAKTTFTGRSVENWVPLKPVLGGMNDVAIFLYPSCADSVKSSLQFSFDFDVIIAPEGSHFITQDFP